MIQSLLDRSDAAGIFAFDHVGDLLGKFKLFLGYDLFVFDDIDGDIVVDESQDIKIEILDGAFYLDDILDAHLIAAGVLDDGHGTVQLVQLQIVINGHCLAGFDMVEDISLAKSSDV